MDGLRPREHEQQCWWHRKIQRSWYFSKFTSYSLPCLLTGFFFPLFTYWVFSPLSRKVGRIKNIGLYVLSGHWHLGVFEVTVVKQLLFLRVPTQWDCRPSHSENPVLCTAALLACCLVLILSHWDSQCLSLSLAQSRYWINICNWPADPLTAKPDCTPRVRTQLAPSWISGIFFPLFQKLKTIHTQYADL